MKCPGCGYSNPEKSQNCKRCGAAIVSEPVPEWRKEVAQKVRAYGDRKKRLTTPPGPLREQENEELAPLPPEDPPPVQAPIPAQPPVPQPRTPVKPVAHREQPVPEQPSAVHPSIEIWSDDLDSDSDAEDASGLYLSRRCAAFLIDHSILALAFGGIAFSVSALLRQESLQLLRMAWPSALGIFLLIHFVYYVYFYATSRQTPGQVFLSLELKLPSSMHVPLQNILLRWIVMIGLNVFNLIPVLFGKQLLLDVFSGTEIRSLRNKRQGNGKWNTN